MIRHRASSALILFFKAALILLCVLAPLTAQAKTTLNEYQVKAAFIYNFARFTSWPQSAFANSNSPFIITIVGKDPFGKDIDEVLGGKSIDGHKIKIVRKRSHTEIGSTHLLFVCQSEKNYVSRILSTVKNRPVLTISDISGFAEKGGVIEFDRIGKNIAFYVNLRSAKDADLKISSKLLRLAEKIKK